MSAVAPASSHASLAGSSAAAAIDSDSSPLPSPRFAPLEAKEKDRVIDATMISYDEIRQMTRQVTLAQYLSTVLNKNVLPTGGDVRLYIPDYAEEVTKSVAESLYTFGFQHKAWDDWFNLFADDAIYIADDDTYHSGKDEIKEKVGGQIALVASMNYKVLNCLVESNCIQLTVGNVLSDKEGNTWTYANTSTYYLNASGKIKLAHDVIDKTVASKRTLAWAAADTVEGGSRGPNFFCGLVTMVKNVCCCCFNPKNKKD
jgi:hypothetical protein